MAAKDTKLNELHEALAEIFLAEIKFCRENDIPMSASDKAVIVRFLKDNSITADITTGEMDQLKQEFEDELAARRKAKAKQLLDSQDDEDPFAGIM